MTDDNYWKGSYQHLWPISGEREDDIAKLIEDSTGKTLTKVGFGTGSDKFLSGTAASHGHEKGEADLFVQGTNIHLEVTGPLIKTVPSSAPLWIRPDKIKNARTHLKDHDTWIVHCLEKEKGRTIRAIRLDDKFLNSYDKGKFSIVKRKIRGKEETMVEIPSNDNTIKDFQVLIDYIKSK